MGPAAHVLPPGHPPERVSSGSPSGAYPVGRTSCASSGSCSARKRGGLPGKGRGMMQDETGKQEEEEAEGGKDEEEKEEEECPRRPQ